MIQSMQPTRPQLRPAQYPPPNPAGYQQQTRATSSQAASQRPPQSQIEAMPPALFQRNAFVPFDPARCHPVFFTPTLRKPPFPLFGPGIAMANPVALGYVNETGMKKEGAAKL